MEEKANGRVVMVHTKHLGTAGTTVMVGYVAGFADRDQAIEAVKRKIGAADDDAVGNTGPISDTTLKALGVNAGDVWML